MPLVKINGVWQEATEYLGFSEEAEGEEPEDDCFSASTKSGRRRRRRRFLRELAADYLRRALE
jgi:hypothetical protein